MVVSKLPLRILCLIVTCFSTNSFAQGIKVTYQNSNKLNVCSYDEFTIFLENSEAIIYQDIDLEIELPNGIRYLPNSVFGGIEKNVANRNRPVISISKINAGEKIKILIKIEADCSAFDQLEKGFNFQNKIIITYGNKKDSILTIPPYTLMTPFLIIAEVNDQDIPLGTIGKRSIKITNTRLGSSSNFIFEDQHNPANIITSDGLILVQNTNLLILQFDAKDFVKIGDRDSLFEENEMIIIEEKISSIDCKPNTFESKFKVQWGCNGKYCQENNETANVQFIESEKKANLSFSESPLAPICICQKEGVIQSLMITNIGEKIAENIELEFRTNINTPTNYGFIKDSISILGNAEIDTIYFQEDNANCKGLNLFYSIIVKIKKLDLNQSLKIFFRFGSCETMPNSGITDLVWYYSYKYSSQCVPSSLVSLSNRPVMFQYKSAGLVDIKTRIDNNVHNITGGQVYNLINRIIYPPNLTNEKLFVYLQLPCPFELVDSLFLLNNRKPSSYEISLNKGLLLKIEYQAPFSIADTILIIPIKIDCNNPCIDSNLILSKVKFTSSCLIGQIIASTLSAEICSAVQLSCPNNLGECGPKSGIIKYGVNFDCNKEEEIKYEVPGYIDYSSLAYRSSYGSADSNNDRRKDLIGKLDTSKILKDRFITGDTLCNEFFGKVVVDKKGASFDSMVFFITTPVTIDDFSVDIELFDFDKNKSYNFHTDQLEKYDEKTKLVNCSEPTLIKTGIGDGYYLRLNPELLNILNPNFPVNYRFEESDSFHVKIFSRAVSFVGFRTAKVNFLHRVLLRDRSNKTERDFFCQRINHELYMVTSCVLFNSPISMDTMCGNNFELPILRFEGLKHISNFFSNEFRSFIKVDSVLVNLASGLQADSAKIRILYIDSFSQRIVLDTFFPFKKGKSWYLNIESLKGLRFDESYRFELSVFGSTSDCNLIKNQSILNADVSMYVSKDFNAKFHLDPVYTTHLDKTILAKTFNIISNNANAYLDFVNKTIITNSKMITWKANLKSLPASGYFRIKINSKKSQISNFDIQSIPAIQIVKSGPNEFVVGPVIALSNYEFIFSALNQACEGDTIFLESTWFCGNAIEEKGNDCVKNTFSIPVVPKQPELELQLEQLDKEVLLCDTLPEVMLYLFNADVGTAYDLYLDLFVPDNVFIDPNSLKIAYPSNALFIPLSLPILISQNHYRWKFKDIVPLINIMGLVGVDNFPSNGLRIKFKSYTSCNSTVNGYFGYLTNAKNNCGENTNFRSLNGRQIRIKGISNDARYKLSTTLDPGNNCTPKQKFKVEIIGNNLSSDKDSVIISIPKPLTFVSGSFKIESNIDNQIPLVKVSNIGEELIIHLKSGVIAGQKIAFQIEIKGFDLLPCSEINIPTLVFSKQVTQCSVTQMPCEVVVVNAQQNLFYSKSSPKLVIDSFEILNNVNDKFKNLKYSINLSGISQMTDSVICFKLFVDVNNNMKLDVADLLIKESCFERSLFIRDGNYFLNDVILSSLINSCAFITTTSAGNCLCNFDTSYLNIHQIQIFHKTDTVCIGEGLDIGINPTLGAKYSWTGVNISCDTCSRIRINFPDTIISGVVLNYILEERFPDSCNKLYRFDIFGLPFTSGRKYMFTGCLNEVIQINAGSHKIFNWIGPDILNSTSYNQSIKLDSSKVIYLNFTDNGFCSSRDTFCFGINKDTNSIFVTPQSITIGYGETARFEVFGGKSFLWTPSFTLDCNTCRMVTAAPFVTTEYEVQVSDSFGCLHLFIVKVIVVQPSCDSSNIFIPNAFSPNGDNKNDVFLARGNDINSFHMIVYSRWGEQLFESYNITQGWDGTFKDEVLPPDVFAYYVEAECIGGRRYIKKGNISLLK